MFARLALLYVLALPCVLAAATPVARGSDSGASSGSALACCQSIATVRLFLPSLYTA